MKKIYVTGLDDQTGGFIINIFEVLANGEEQVVLYSGLLPKKFVKRYQDDPGYQIIDPKGLLRFK